MATRIKFETKSDRCSVAFIKKTRADVHGKIFQATEACRAIREGNIWRIDYAGNVAGAWLPWEPINETEYADLRAAKRAIREYAAAPAPSAVEAQAYKPLEYFPAGHPRA